MRLPASPLVLLVVGIHLLLALGAAIALFACSGEQERVDGTRGSAAGRDGPVVEDAGPIHVHALGVNPKDGSLFIATHTGLFRASRPGAKPRRVAGRYQDTMGFTVISADHFFASGHPDGREELPPFLGLIESTDAGRTWNEVSLQGSIDFHVLEVAGRRIYGFGADWDTREERFLVSSDRGETWRRQAVPEPLIDLAIAPGDPDTAAAAGSSGLYLTRDAGRSWSALPAGPALLTWLGRQLLAVDQRGLVRVATDAFGRWQARGRVGGKPAALAAGPGRKLYVALHDGTIKRSSDRGASWSVWGTPAKGRKGAAGADDSSAPASEPEGSQGGSEESVNRSHKALRDVPGEAKTK
jgi:hypothetical protein